MTYLICWLVFLNLHCVGMQLCINELSKKIKNLEDSGVNLTRTRLLVEKAENERKEILRVSKEVQDALSITKDKYYLCETKERKIRDALDLLKAEMTNAERQIDTIYRFITLNVEKKSEVE